jgi:hypothetical protein
VPPRKDPPPGAEVELASDAGRRASVLEMRVTGLSYPAIATLLGISPAVALADGRRALADRARELECAEQAAALEIERLDAQQRLLTAVAADAAGRHDLTVALETADRLAVLSERRLAVAAALSERGDTEQAVVADLARMPERLRTSAAGRVAVLLARHLDAGLPAASMTSVTRELRVTLEGLAKLAPDDREESVVDDLRLRRAKRLAGESEGTGS